MNALQTFFDQAAAAVINAGKKAEAGVASCPCLGKLEENAAAKSPKAAAFIKQMRPRMLWLLLFLGILALLLLLNLFIQPLHPHFGVDKYPWFWAFFGLGVGLAMIFVMKRIIQPLIVRKEDYYGDI